MQQDHEARKSESHWASVTLSLLKKLEERDNEITQLRNEIASLKGDLDE